MGMRSVSWEVLDRVIHARRVVVSFVVLLVLADGCGDGLGPDADRDGWLSPEDCGVYDPQVYPGAPEICGDDVVNDCDTTEAEARDFCALWRELTVDAAPGTFTGENRGDRAGAAVSGGGDLTGDGVADLLVGAPGSGSEGGAWILSGGARGEEDLEVAEARLEGVAGAYAGAAVAGPGDLDGDGMSDVVVSAPGASGSDYGRVYLGFGPFSGDIRLDDMGVSVRGAYRVGTALAFGDLSGDGGVGLAVGAPALDGETLDGEPATDSGGIYWVEGPFVEDRAFDDADLWVVGEGAAESVGSVLALGDLDGDGVADLGVGVPGVGAGRVAIFAGPPAGPLGLSAADVVLTGVREASATGAAIATGGDVDGDGRDDLIVGAPDAEDGGAAYLIVAPGTGGLADLAHASLGATHPSESAGAAVAILGDVDADGFADIGVGAPTAEAGAGAAFVVYGPVHASFDLSDSNIIIIGQSPEDAVGGVFAAASDLDGDGRADFALGGPGHGSPETEMGAVWLFLAAPI